MNTRDYMYPTLRLDTNQRTGTALYKWYPTFLSSSKKSLKIPKGAIRICISKKNRQHNGQKKRYKRTNNDLQERYFFCIAQYEYDIISVYVLND